MPISDQSLPASSSPSFQPLPTSSPRCFYLELGSFPAPGTCTDFCALRASSGGPLCPQHSLNMVAPIVLTRAGAPLSDGLGRVCASGKCVQPQGPFSGQPGFQALPQTASRWSGRGRRVWRAPVMRMEARRSWCRLMSGRRGGPAWRRLVGGVSGLHNPSSHLSAVLSAQPSCHQGFRSSAPRGEAL